MPHLDSRQPVMSENLTWDQALYFMRQGHWLTNSDLEPMGLHLTSTESLAIIYLVRTADGKMMEYQPTNADRCDMGWKVIRG